MTGQTNNVEFYHGDKGICMRVSIPGERWGVIDRPATGQDFNRWPRQYQQFQRGEEQTPDGTPIEELFPINVTRGLKVYSIYTIEQLATLSGNAIDSIGMGSQKWVNLAQKWVADNNRGISKSDHKRDMERLEASIKHLQDQIDGLRTGHPNT